MTDDAGRPGDVLVLTRPLGSGITAAAGDACPPDVAGAMARAAEPANEVAAEVAAGLGVTAGAVLGERGLLGGLCMLAAASGTGAAVRVDRVPVVDGVLRLVSDGTSPAAAEENREAFADRVDLHPLVTAEARVVLWDAQPQGGMLLAVPVAGLRPLLEGLLARGVRAVAIGQLLEEPVGRVGVVSPVDRIGATGGGSQTAAVEAPEGAPPPPPGPMGGPMGPAGGMPPGMTPGMPA